jgi:phosphate starvation-inducible membrane PsiE
MVHASDEGIVHLLSFFLLQLNCKECSHFQEHLYPYYPSDGHLKSTYDIHRALTSIILLMMITDDDDDNDKIDYIMIITMMMMMMMVIMMMFNLIDYNEGFYKFNSLYAYT